MYVKPFIAIQLVPAIGAFLNMLGDFTGEKAGNEVFYTCSDEAHRNIDFLIWTIAPFTEKSNFRGNFDDILN